MKAAFLNRRKKIKSIFKTRKQTGNLTLEDMVFEIANIMHICFESKTIKRGKYPNKCLFFHLCPGSRCGGFMLQKNVKI